MTYLKELPKIETRLEVRNEVDDGPAELYLYGVIRSANAWDNENNKTFITAKMVLDKLEELGNKDLDIHLNTRGGDADESIAIRNNLKRHGGRVHVYVDSLAASGGSIIATGADKVLMYESSRMFIHKGWTIAIGNADELMRVAANLEKLDDSIIKNYMSKFVGTEEELKQLLKEETELTAEECLAFGLADEIIKDEDLEDDGEEKEEQNNVKENLFNKYKNKNNTKKKYEGKPDNKSGLFNAFKKSNSGGKE